MPLYSYRCEHCGERKELFRKVADYNKPGPSHCFDNMTRVIAAPRVIRDIEPYQAMGVDIETGKAPMITSRSQHRDYLKRNGYVEVGTSTPPPPPPAYEPDKKEIARQLKHVMDGGKLD